MRLGQPRLICCGKRFILAKCGKCQGPNPTAGSDKEFSTAGRLHRPGKFGLQVLVGHETRLVRFSPADSQFFCETENPIHLPGLTGH